MINRSDKSDSLFAVAESQHGYFTSAKAKSLGYDYPLQFFHVKRGNWIRVDQLITVFTGSKNSLRHGIRI